MQPLPRRKPRPRPGLLVLHGNRLELLAEATFAWLAAHPLDALEEETILVQSNGMAEWFKMALAAAHGVCAATRVELPARFIWRAYRAVLGRAAVPALPALDKQPLTWRLMGLLPVLAELPGFEPVAGFLGRGDAARRLQLAQRLADLFDQYQVYRSDWLQDWEQGLDQIRPSGAAGGSQGVSVPAEQRWQPALWRAAVAGLNPADRNATRAVLHQRFLHALQGPGDWPALPRRVVLFGTTHIPQQTLEAIAALSAHTQVLMAVPNPCRYHWADTIDGRQALHAARRRQPLRGGLNLADVPLQDLHAHGHPLLSAWGRQSRDFVRQLDAFDDAQRARDRFELPRIDLFDEGPGLTLLQQVQARIRDLSPLSEHAGSAVAPTDRSIVFQVAHSAQREVEVLHDQLLHLLAHPPPGQPLNPRDIVVMVPDIDTFAPAIRSVFGALPRGHARHIPWGIADQRERGHQPLLLALEWLLRAPQQRYTASAVRDLLDLPALAGRFGIAADDLPTLAAWVEGAAVRWGLHAGQRSQLGLAACGETNTWRFGLRRMLLGYATGELADGHQGIEPYAEVAGLSAALAGSLAELLDALQAWWADAAVSRTPADWGLRLRGLLEAVFLPTDDADRAVLVALDDALSNALQACETAGFEEPVDVAVMREAWLGAVDDPAVARRFKAGGVTFCTLLPLRAIPFEVVCLLGMNDGDYPRHGTRSDFDLMALPGQARPGDRLRRDDDRQLMLDAVLSARRLLYLSWAGRSPRDNQAQPPSILVSQLSDYLDAGWGAGVVHARTTEHPLQPFSRRYFEVQGEAGDDGGGAVRGPAAAERALFTYAAEWRSAHVLPPPGGAADPAAGDAGRSAGALPVPLPVAVAVAVAVAGALPVPVPLPVPVTIGQLAAFLRNPVKAFFRQRLQVRFDEQPGGVADDEPFVTGGLERWQLLDDLLGAARSAMGTASHSPEALGALIAGQMARLRRAGRLPMAGPGNVLQAALAAELNPMLLRWQALQAQFPLQLDNWPLRLDDPLRPGLALADGLSGLRSRAVLGATPTWFELQASPLADGKGRQPRADRLLAAWVRSLATAACGQPAAGVLIGADAVIEVAPLEPAAAAETLLGLLRALHDGLAGDRPLPTAVLTGLALLLEPARARQAYEGSGPRHGLAEGREACLARLYPDFDALSADPAFEVDSRRLYGPYRAWLDQHVRIELLAAGAGSTAFAED